MAYLKAKNLTVTTWPQLHTAKYRFALSRATAAALARLDAEIEGVQQL